jgi:16S rRNA (cytidine1402-2'-O)-methyltransferase
MPSSSATEPAGKLCVVGTPIGNLGDITSRAVESLRAADRILAEDTRRTRALLNHLGIIGKPLASIEAHVSDARLANLVEFLRAGETLALVTDAGMPGVSDPGAKMVRLAREAGFAVEVAPGPSAVTAAIALSGLVEGPFYFAGFLPRHGKRRERAKGLIQHFDGATVLFEAGNRTRATLADLAQKQPGRRAAVCRELTKLHEEVTEATLSELAALEREWRGEVVIVLASAPAEDGASCEDNAIVDDERLSAELESGKTVRDLLDASGLSGKERRALYVRLLALRRGKNSIG